MLKTATAQPHVLHLSIERKSVKSFVKRSFIKSQHRKCCNSFIRIRAHTRRVEPESYLSLKALVSSSHHSDAETALNTVSFPFVCSSPRLFKNKKKRWQMDKHRFCFVRFFILLGEWQKSSKFSWQEDSRWHVNASLTHGLFSVGCERNDIFSLLVLILCLSEITDHLLCLCGHFSRQHGPLWI